MVEYKSENNIAYYKIYENGYYIEFKDKNLSIKQEEPLIPFKHLSYEENAIRQIEEQFALFDLKNQPTSQDDINSMLIDQEYRLLMLELDV